MPGDIFGYISALSYLFFLPIHPIPPQAPSFSSSSSSIQKLPNQINPNHTSTHYLNYISHPHTQPSPAPPVLPKPPLGSATMLATWGYKAYKKHQEKKRLARLSEPGQSLKKSLVIHLSTKNNKGNQHNSHHSHPLPRGSSSYRRTRPRDGAVGRRR